jgi:ribonuclease BN (tRNA processing enzyme)
VEEEAPGGGVLVYSGDTGPSDALVRLADGADLLLIESAFLDDGSDNPPGMHLSGVQAAAIAKVSGARAAVLTHIPPWHKPDDVLAEAKPHFDGPLSLASPGAVWDIGG